ncbi:MAG: PepSY domain-containing protein [Nitrospirae bacterium]|nr:PepSY domain-containing protein [Nitrospirota bacterium]
MIKRRWVGIGLGLGSLLVAGCGGGEQGKSFLIRHATVTLSQAVEIGERNVPGRAVKAELESSGSRVMYQMEIIDAVNRTHKVWIDAETGKVVE